MNGLHPIVNVMNNDELLNFKWILPYAYIRYIRKYSNSTRIQYNLHSIINIPFIQSSDQVHHSDLICEEYSHLGDIIINVLLLPPASGCVMRGLRDVSRACLKIMMCCF